MVHFIFLKHRVHTSQHIDLCIWYWVKLLKNSFINIIYLIISRTENNMLQEVLVILNSWVANSWIDPVDESIEISANYRLRNLYHLIIIHSWSSTNFQQPLSMLIVSFRVAQVYIVPEMLKKYINK